MMQITPSQNVQLAAGQTNQTKTNSASINESVSPQTNTQLDSQIRDKASDTLQPDVVNIGKNQASSPVTYDIKTMTRQTTTSYTGSAADTPPTSVIPDNSGDTTIQPTDPDSDGNGEIKPAYTGSGGDTAPNPA